MRIEKREDELKALFVYDFRYRYTAREFFVMLHQDVRKSGYPDIAVHGNKLSTHWEFKHATPDFSSPGVQEITCRKIAMHAYCRYVIFLEHGDLMQTWIVHPDRVYKKDGKALRIKPEQIFEGFDFARLSAFVHSIHYPVTA